MEFWCLKWREGDKAKTGSWTRVVGISRAAAKAQLAEDGYRVGALIRFEKFYHCEHE